MRGKEHCGSLVFAFDFAPDVIGRPVSPNFGFRVEYDAGFAVLRDLPFEQFRVAAGNGERGRVIGAADVLRVERYVADFSVTAALDCDKRRRAL